MTDEPKEPTVQLEKPAQPAPSAPVTDTQDVIDWEARYKGASKKINELTSVKAELEAKQADYSTQIEQLKSQLGIKDVEKDTAVGEYQKQLETALQEQSQAKKELESLQAYKAKMDMAKKLGAPELVNIIDRIPYVEDPEALETIMKDFVSWGNDFAKRREEQLMAGVTPPVAATEFTDQLPQTHDSWRQQLLDGNNKEGLTWDRYWEWAKTHGE